MTVFHFLHNLHIISLSICVSNTTALAEIGCLHQRLWRYNLVIIFLFRFINFCFLVYVIDSHFSWRVWQIPTMITRRYTYILIFVWISFNLKKDHSMTEMCRLKNLVIFFQTIITLTCCFLIDRQLHTSIILYQNYIHRA